MLGKGAIFGNPYIGVFCAASEKLAIVPMTVDEEFVSRVKRLLEVDNAIRTSVDGSSVAGALMCMNSSGALVSHFATELEMKKIGAHLNVSKVSHRFNAVGNNILANDKGALVHSGFDDATLRLVSDILGVPVERGTVGGYNTVGSAAMATNKGVLVHPHASRFELEQLERVLGVKPQLCTANYGSGLVGACMIANSKGALVGETSTPIELGKVEEGLVLY